MSPRIGRIAIGAMMATTALVALGIPTAQATRKYLASASSAIRTSKRSVLLHSATVTSCCVT